MFASESIGFRIPAHRSLHVLKLLILEEYKNEKLRAQSSPFGYYVTFIESNANGHSHLRQMS